MKHTIRQLLLLNSLLFSLNFLSALPSESTQIFSQRFDHHFFKLNDQFFILGGRHATENTEFSIDNDVWVSGNLATWTRLNKTLFPVRKHGYSLGVFKNRVWIYGGFEPANQRFIGDIWSSDNGWSYTLVTRKSPFKPRIEAAVFEFNKTFWLIGGNQGDEEFFNDIWYSANGYDWKKSEKTLPFYFQYRPDIVIVENTVYLFSQKNGVYTSADGENWTRIAEPEILIKRKHFSVVRLNQNFILIGGETVSDGPIFHDLFNDIWSSEKGTDWVQIAPYPVDSLYPNRNYIYQPPRSSQRTMIVDNKIVMTGGLDFSGKPLNEIWISENGYFWIRTR